MHSLYHLIINKGRKNVLVNLGTGHGKSVVIQMLAMVLNSQQNKRVFVVCLNNFLAAQSRIKYNKEGGINYLPYSTFKRMLPSEDILVIYDEFD